MLEEKGHEFHDDREKFPVEKIIEAVAAEMKVKPRKLLWAMADFGDYVFCVRLRADKAEPFADALAGRLRCHHAVLTFEFSVWSIDGSRLLAEREKLG